MVTISLSTPWFSRPEMSKIFLKGRKTVLRKKENKNERKETEMKLERKKEKLVTFINKKVIAIRSRQRSFAHGFSRFNIAKWMV